jgi:BlaI family penicillinase repressor
MDPLIPPEEAALRAIWQAGGGFVKELLPYLPAPPPPYTTLASTLHSLARKGYVQAKKMGSSYHFTALVNAADYQRRSVRTLVQQHFQNSYKDLLCFFAQEEHINADDLRELLQLIEQGAGQQATPGAYPAPPQP